MCKTAGTQASKARHDLRLSLVERPVVRPKSADSPWYLDQPIADLLLKALGVLLILFSELPCNGHDHNPAFDTTTPNSSSPAEPIDEQHLAIRAHALLKTHCDRCHGASKREGGLRLTSRAEALLRNDSGKPAIVPFRPNQSVLVDRLESPDPDHRMPLNSPPLDADSISLIRQWIEAGAAWPADDTSSATHWAYVKPTRVPLESPLHIAIDSWIEKKLTDSGLANGLSPREQPARLLRRVYLDLIGLPPTPAEVEAFEENPDDKHYTEVVDRLLSSPRFGEKWASQWLDLARYADSNGYQADQFRTIWPYRDWVIQAMNDDMPFDQFTIEQLAGDLLPNATETTRIATGFNRCATCNVEAGVDPEENRTNQVADRVTTLSTTWLGTTLECARCHNHKYDPFTQEDFYQLYAFFNNTPLEVDPPKDGGVQYEVAGPVLPLTRTSGDGSVQGSNPILMPVLAEMPTRRQTHIFRRGDFLSPGAEVHAQTPGILPPLKPASDDGLPPTRLDLAKWLVDRDHPLTARVVVNRWWAAFFGHGLVKTQEDFGTQGERPSHPELLDLLAVEFMENNWSMKSLHRQIVLSRTYQQSSIATPELRHADPENRLLARGPRFRLPAELIRDQALAISGLLSTQMGGPPVYPPQPDGLWRHVGRNAPKYTVSQDGHRYRRGIYVVWRRSAPYPSFVNFDAPDRASCVPQRSTSNTPLQALTLLNDPAYVEMCHAFARRILTETTNSSDAEKVITAFRLTVARKPAEKEANRLLQLLQEQRAKFQQQPDQAEQLVPQPFQSANVSLIEQAAWFSIANVLLNLDETISRN